MLVEASILPINLGPACKLGRAFFFDAPEPTGQRAGARGGTPTRLPQCTVRLREPRLSQGRAAQRAPVVRMFPRMRYGYQHHV